MNVVSRIVFLHVWVVNLSNAQFVPESESYQDDLSFLDVAVDRGENARLCVCSQNFFYFTIPYFPGPVDENGVSCQFSDDWALAASLGGLWKVRGGFLFEIGRIAKLTTV